MVCAGTLSTQESIVMTETVRADSFISAVGVSRLVRGCGVMIGPTFGGTHI